MLSSRAAWLSRSVSSLGMTSAASRKRIRASIQAGIWESHPSVQKGYPLTQTSGKTTREAPFLAASRMVAQALSIVFFRSRNAEGTCATAIFTDSRPPSTGFGCGSLIDMTISPDGRQTIGRPATAALSVRGKDCPSIAKKTDGAAKRELIVILRSAQMGVVDAHVRSIIRAPHGERRQNPPSDGRTVLPVSAHRQLRCLRCAVAP